jgi:hydroxypyruvate isomerase
MTKTRSQPDDALHRAAVHRPLPRCCASRLQGVEFLFPYVFRHRRRSPTTRKNELELVLHNLPAGDWEAGERGIACHPDRVSEFRQGVDDAIRYAKVLGVKQLNCLVGIQPQGVSAPPHARRWSTNLKFAAGKLQGRHTPC